MHKEILTAEQIKFFPFLKKFSKTFGLAGGTAIAFHLGHRESIDFDLASLKDIDSGNIRKNISKFGKIEAVMQDSVEEYSFVLNGVKFTFFHYPFQIKFTKKIDGVISSPDILTLAAMKAYALGRRAKWKDYVDLYFIAKKYGSISPIIKKSKSIFKGEFNEKNFRAQLTYFEDIDYSEKVIYRKGFEIDEKTIMKALTKFSLS